MRRRRAIGRPRRAWWPTATSACVFDGRLATLGALLQAFPEDAADTDPELALAFAKARLYDGLLEESAHYIAMVERRADAVPEERRQRFELQLAEIRLALARRRGDLATVQETMRPLEAALAAQPASARGLGNDLRAAALMNLGIAELWASRGRGRLPSPRAGARARATHRAAVSRARLPRPSGDRGPAARQARLGLARALRARRWRSRASTDGPRTR